MPPSISDRAIVAHPGIDRADGGNPNQLRRGGHAQTNRRRDRDAHAGIRTRPETHHDEIRCAESQRTTLQIFKEQTRVLAIVRKADSEWIALEPRDASLPA